METFGIIMAVIFCILLLIILAPVIGISLLSFSICKIATAWCLRSISRVKGMMRWTEKRTVKYWESKTEANSYKRMV